MTSLKQFDRAKVTNNKTTTRAKISHYSVAVVRLIQSLRGVDVPPAQALKLPL